METGDPAIYLIVDIDLARRLPLSDGDGAPMAHCRVARSSVKPNWRQNVFVHGFLLRGTLPGSTPLLPVTQIRGQRHRQKSSDGGHQRRGETH